MTRTSPIETNNVVERLAEAIEQTADEAMEWAKKNTGNGAQEIFMAQVAVSGTLKLLASKLRASLTQGGKNG